MVPNGIIQRFQRWQEAGPAQSADDAQLLGTFRHQRCEIAFREIVRRHGAMVLAAARRVLGSGGDADDVFQATFLLLAQRPQAVKRGEALGSWLYGVAYRLALRQQRGQRRRQKHEGQAARPAVDSATREAVAHELQAEVLAALATLPASFRQPLIYCGLEERTPDEAARLLGCPVGTLWSRLSRAREKLRLELHRRGWPLEALALATLLPGTSDAARLPELTVTLLNAIQFTPTVQVLPHGAAVAKLLMQEHARQATGSALRLATVLCLALAGGWGLLTVTAFAVGAWPQDQAAAVPPSPTTTRQPAAETGTLRGIITAKDTGEPVPGASVVYVVSGVPNDRRLRRATTDAQGRYAASVPFGHLTLRGIWSPPGFLTQDEQAWKSFSASAAEPVRTVDFQLQRGTSWRLELPDVTPKPLGEMPFHAAFAALPNPQRQHFKTGEEVTVASDATGRGTIALPPGATRFRLNCLTGVWHDEKFIVPPANLQFDAGFDPNRVIGPIEQLPEGKRQRAKDDRGRTATVEGADLRVDGQQLVIRFRKQGLAASQTVQLQGRLVDEAGKPVPGAKVTLCCQGKTGGGVLHYTAVTDDGGRFSLRPNFGTLRQDDGLKLYVIAVKSGYAGVESAKIDLTEAQKQGSGDFGMLVLGPGHPLKGRVVDVKGRPLVGAVVGNATHYFLYSHLECRTNQAGEFTMPDLPYGEQRLRVSLGERFADETVEFSAKQTTCEIVMRHEIIDRPQNDGKR